MLSFDKTYLDRLAAESGFIRDNLEKVLRLVEILKFFHNHALLSQALVLKGGTAINLTVFDMPRLSVDIDLDFNINCGREEMLTQRDAINDLIMRYMVSEGYGLKPSSKSPFSLDSWIFGYTNASGNPDNIKIEINYSDRCHALPSIESPLSIDILGDAKINTLAPVELFASKINALVNRGAMRDLYDVNEMIDNNLFSQQNEQDLLRRLFVFYLSVGATSKAEDVNLQFTVMPKIESANYAQVRAQLIPVLRRSDRFDFEQAKRNVLDYLGRFLQFSESEHDFVAHFNRREYRPKILFGPGDIADCVINHPMALWKCRPADA